MKLIAIVLFITCLTSLFFPKDPKKLSEAIEKEYIKQHSSLAIREMKLFHIPASIILSQAILESNSGLSELSINANNHFGIKCKEDWYGNIYYYTDDKPNECFRKYNDVEESYRDHSVFLTGRKWYAGLFKLDICDYKGWAIGLKNSGYATDPNYATKLITIIERHNLSALDK